MEKNKQYYRAYRLYILRPSRIIGIVKNNVTFETIPNQIVISEKPTPNQNLYIPITEEILAEELLFEQYYNQIILEKQGLQKEQEKAGFVGLFPNDIISLLDLPDFEFIQSLGEIGPIKHLEYFNYKNKLRPKYHRELDKIQYTKEELEQLKEYIIENVLPKEEKAQIITKKYIAVYDGKEKPILTAEDYVRAFNDGETPTDFSRTAPSGYIGYGNPLLVRRRIKSIADAESNLDKFANKKFGI